MTKTVYLVGAGPGDPGLLTVRGRAILGFADVVVYDRLVGEEILDWCRADTEKIYVGKAAANHAMTQDEINALLVEKAQSGKTVCRLKGGDPFVFGRGGEEALYCRAHHVRFEIVPGVSSVIAAPAYAGIPITQREIASSFAVVTGHTKDDDAPPADLPVADTIIFLMGVRALPKIVAQLLARGDSPDTPVALVRWGTTTKQQVVTGTLETIESDVARAGLLPPALIVVGEVVRLRNELKWFDNKPLFGHNIVVTRAREQASSLVEELRGRGANVIQCPTIRVEELDDYQAIDEALEFLSSFNWIVFTSTNSVEYFWRRLENSGRDARALGGAKVTAIGPATRDALKSRGIVADFIPENSMSESVAQGLIARGIEGELILIARALEGRAVLEEKLHEAGAEVLIAPLYRTVADESEAENVREMLKRGEISWISFSSGSTVKNFCDAVGLQNVLDARSGFRVACIGPITAGAARECGIEPEVIAQSASVESLADAMESYAVNSRQQIGNRTDAKSTPE